MKEKSLKLWFANPSRQDKNIKQMLCTGLHCPHDSPSTKMKSEMDNAEVGRTKYTGNTGRRVVRLGRKQTKTEPFSSTGCSKRNCRSYLD